MELIIFGIGAIITLCIIAIIRESILAKNESITRELEEKNRIWNLEYMARDYPKKFKALIKQKEKQLARLNAIKTDEDFVAYNIAETIYEISELERIEIQEEMEK